MIVARGFRIGGWVVGVPALVILIALIATLSHPSTPPDHSTYLDVQKYGIAGLLANSAHAAGRAFDWLGGIAEWLGKALAIAFAAILLWAAVLYFAGRGMARRSGAARVVGLLMSLSWLLLSLALLPLLPRGMIALPILGTALSAYVIWVLGWRYA
ncbi:MAG: hypothetical protein JO056_03885 [Alphaproteobacteria bacterium]|nr:hypothetical protein [Alphaproteobacteria bacterium]